MTTLTLLTLAVVVYGACNSRGYGRALALGGATPAGVTLVFGTTSVPTFYAVAIGAGVGLAVQLLTRTRRFQRVDAPRIPGMVPLLLLTFWAILVTLAAPLLFHGLEVLAPGGSERPLTAGVLTPSNLAQIVYLVLGVCIVVLLARSRWAGPEIIGTAAGLATVLSFWSYLGTTFGLPYPVGFFDNSPTYVFIDMAPGGIPRFRGIFSEPAGLATSSLVTLAYMLSRVTQVKGLRRLGVIAVLGMAAFLAVVSTSATFIVAGVALAAIAAATLVATVVLRRGAMSPLGVTIACAGVIAGLWLLPLLANMVETVVDDKVASSSYTERSGADALSYQLLFETFGVGVGIGSHRPSSFLAALLSTIGIVGTLLFAAVVLIIVRRAYPLKAYRPVVWALTALLTTKIVSGPDLADTSGILWMSLGVLAHAGLSVRTAAASASVAPPDAPRLRSDSAAHLPRP